jgi:hypothetical protein
MTAIKGFLLVNLVLEGKRTGERAFDIDHIQIQSWFNYKY